MEPPEPTRSALSAQYGAGASQHDEETLKAWLQQWTDAQAAAKAKRWADVVELLENCRAIRPDFAKGYVPLSRAHRQLDNEKEAVAVLRSGLTTCAAHGSAEPIVAELRKLEASAASTAADAADAADDAALAAASASPPPMLPPVRESSLSRAAAASLEAAGFERAGYAWRHPPTETLVIEAADGVGPPEVYNASLRQADIDERVALSFAVGAWEGFGAGLVRWVADAIVQDGADGAGPAYDDGTHGEDEEDDGAVDVGIDRLPTPAQLGATTDRPLTIYTWGDKVVSQVHLEHETGCVRHFNAKPLNGRGGGASLKVNATQDACIVRNVCASMAGGEGAEWLRRLVHTVERADEHAISVYCSQGRHRSVGAALVLVNRYYPNARFVPIKMR